MRALGAYEAGICACGFHTSLATDLSNFFAIEEVRCPVCATADRYGRIQQANDDADKKRAGDNPPPTRAEPGDGRHTFVRRMSPDEAHQRLTRDQKEVPGGNTPRVSRP